MHTNHVLNGVRRFGMAAAHVGFACALLLGCSSNVVYHEPQPGGGAAGAAVIPDGKGLGGQNVGGGGQSSGAGGQSSGAGGGSSYSPESCRAAGGMALPSIGTPQDPARDCASGTAYGSIDAASSGWDEGGLCCAPLKDGAPIRCGARAGNTCTANEYCAYEEGGLCGAADAESFCKARPPSCIESQAPVCGCDRKTYVNSCQANAAGTGIFSAGQCS